MRLHSQILIGLLAGATAGALANVLDVAWLQWILSAVEPLGTAWIQLIMMTVLPLVVASLLVGVSALGDLKSLGRVGGKTLTLFLANTVVAATIGLVLALTVKPGSWIDESVQMQLAAQFQSEAAGHVEVLEGAESLSDQLLGMIPRNPVDAAASAGARRSRAAHLLPHCREGPHGGLLHLVFECDSAGDHGGRP